MVLAFMGSQFPVSERRKWNGVSNPPTCVGGSNWNKQQAKCRADGASRRVCFKELQSTSLESGIVCVTRRLASAARKWKKNQAKCRADGASRRVCFRELQSASLESGFGVCNPPTSVGGSKKRIVVGTNCSKEIVEPMAQAVGLVLKCREIATCQSLKASLEALAHNLRQKPCGAFA